MSASETRLPYSGTERELVIAFDVGTTFSGISYTILIPNQVPRVYNVQGYKGQEELSSSTKVPTVLYYDRDGGDLLACGSEGVELYAGDDESCIKVEWFKLLLRPASLAGATEIPPITLPPHHTVEDVLVDFLRFLQGCVRDYITRTHVDGKSVWNDLGSSPRYLLTHPNGWGGYQQGQMRDAAVRSGLVADSADGRQRVEFVSEGEASFHWCVEEGLVSSTLEIGSQVVVADCGGGTIDVSSFRVINLKPLQLEETASPECRFAGSVMVTHAFRQILPELLEGSEYSTEVFIDKATNEFDKKTKCRFHNSAVNARIEIGSPRDEDPKVRIRHGVLTVSGFNIAAAFERSCSEVEEAIRVQVRKNKEAHVFLVGGFAASPWLLKELERRMGGTINGPYRAETNTAKAVAHGALIYHFGRYIAGRVPRYTYGVAINWHFNASDPEHLKRLNSAYVDEVTGKKLVPGGFDQIVTKGETIKADATYRGSYTRNYNVKQSNSIKLSLNRYNGSMNKVTFCDMDEVSAFQTICTFSADIPADACVSRQGLRGAYWELAYDVVVTLGTSEIKGFIEWKSAKGETMKSLATSTWEYY